jgi:phosphoribosylformylglycinamidine synthase subunit PurS
MKKYKAEIKITLRENILDVQGKTIEHALSQLDYDMMDNVRIGKYITLEVEAQNDGQAEVFVKDACEKLLSNTVIEDFSFTLE